MLCITKGLRTEGRDVCSTVKDTGGFVRDTKLCCLHRNTHMRRLTTGVRR